MNNCDYNSVLVNYLTGLSVLKEHPFSLLDVGVSGGIDSQWRQFEPHLTGIGFDPLVNEVRRLQRIETNPGVRYIDGWITTHDESVRSGVEGTGYRNNVSFAFTSAAKAAQAMAVNYTREYFNQGEELLYSEDHFSLDEFLEQENIAVDFLKIDTDGHDLCVLDGAKNALASGELLGIEVECQFHGSTHPHANVFSNIDQRLRAMGYTLFDMDCWHYTREDLPGEFFYDIPAQTKSGQIQWAEAVYFLDPFTDKERFRALTEPDSTHKALKLLALFSLYGQNDSAARFLNMLKLNAIEMDKLDIEHCLDLLVPESHRSGVAGYSDFISQFERDPRSFYPTNNKVSTD